MKKYPPATPEEKALIAEAHENGFIPERLRELIRYRHAEARRHYLPKRRLAETITVHPSDGNPVTLSIGYDPADPNRPREVFYSGGYKSGSQLEFHVSDACVLMSLLLQHGLQPEAIAHALARTELPNGSTTCASIIGLIAEQLSAIQWAHAMNISRNRIECQ